MRDLSPFNFGLVVAYLIPGFVVLSGASLLIADPADVARHADNLPRSAG